MPSTAADVSVPTAEGGGEVDVKVDAPDVPPVVAEKPKKRMFALFSRSSKAKIEVGSSFFLNET